MEYGEERKNPHAREFTVESALMLADAYIRLAGALEEADFNRAMWRMASACGDAAREEQKKQRGCDSAIDESEEENE